MLLAGAAIRPGVDSTLAPWRSLLIQILHLDSFLATSHFYMEKNVKAVLSGRGEAPSRRYLAVEAGVL